DPGVERGGQARLGNEGASYRDASDIQSRHLAGLPFVVDSPVSGCQPRAFGLPYGGPRTPPLRWWPAEGAPPLSSPNAWREAGTLTVPVMFGYLPLGAAFGILAIEVGIPAWAALLMSLAIYAGA